MRNSGTPENAEDSTAAGYEGARIHVRALWRSFVRREPCPIAFEGAVRCDCGNARQNVSAGSRETPSWSRGKCEEGAWGSGRGRWRTHVGNSEAKNACWVVET